MDNTAEEQHKAATQSCTVVVIMSNNMWQS